MLKDNFYNQVIDIDIDQWQRDEQYDGIYSEGAREKDLYFSPADPKTDVIKPNWHYMFKLSRSIEWCPWQFWVEIIAYRLGCLIGVKVPPAHVGYTAQYGLDEIPAYGSLIEWFYDENSDVFIHGGQFMVQLIEDYDRDKGKKHNFNSVSAFVQIPDFVKHWTGVFVLDTLIANTDRHHDNWGIVLQGGKAKPDKAKMSFAPAFDNGTAMEHGQRESNFYKFNDPNKLNKHLTNPRFAKHHMKWSLQQGQDSPLNFFQFVAEFALKYPESKSIIDKHLSFTRAQVEEILFPLCDFVGDKEYRLTPTRLEFMLDMLFHRKLLLEKTLDL